MTTDFSRFVGEAYRVLGAPAERERIEEFRLVRAMAFADRVAGGYAGKRVLELGSSVGIHLVAARRAGASEAVGLDKFIFPESGESPFRHDTATHAGLARVWQAEGVRVLAHDLADPFPFPDRSFDLVTCHAAIEHFHGIHKQVFAEAFRVLAPGGHFVFSTPNIASLLKRVRFVLGRSPNWDIKDYFDAGTDFTGHVREFTVAECRAMLAWSGFVPVSVVARPGYFRWRWLRNPRKMHHVFFQAASLLSPRWGDFIYAAGRKPPAAG
ncbi:class I SAM-dependent methyltransferase [Patescibacteria group bacterium]|nr:MAG: class I SAM-dependent methyltransferase [Patescibacteria group bacterium]